MKVLVAPSSFGQVDPGALSELEASGLQVIRNHFGRMLTRAELLSMLPGVAGLIAGLESLDREVLEESSLKVISRCGSGMSNVDLEAAEDLHISVFSTPLGPTIAVAELTLGAMITLLRGISTKDQKLREGCWDKRMGEQLHGKTVAVIGFGRIGQKVAELLSVFGARTVAVDPALTGSVAGVPIVTLEKALASSDIITLHCSGAGELLGPKQFGMMKGNVYLLNAARGGLVNEQALMESLDSGHVAGAWLDTFSTEPYVGPLRAYEQVVLTPHIGSYTVECRRKMEAESVENLLKGLETVGAVLLEV